MTGRSGMNSLFVKQIGELLKYIEDRRKIEDAAEKRVQQRQKGLLDYQMKTAEGIREDRSKMEQKNDPELDRLNEEYEFALEIRDNCYEQSKISSQMFSLGYSRAWRACVSGFGSIRPISSKQDEKNKQFLTFCRNIKEYVTETRGKSLQDIQTVLRIVDAVRTVLGALFTIHGGSAI
ncbi:hypothetical protein ACEPAH_9314 [Sanghuangporus vaninii]